MAEKPVNKQTPVNHHEYCIIAVLYISGKLIFTCSKVKGSACTFLRQLTQPHMV